MILELEKQEEVCYEEIIEVLVPKLQNGKDLKLKIERKVFVEVLCSKVKKEFFNFVKAMITDYLRLLKQYSKGKRFGLFEQAWLMHIEDYFTETTTPPVSSDSYSVWKSVIDKCDCDCSIKDQRIIVSTIAYIVYDTMTEKEKDHKSQFPSAPIESEAAREMKNLLSLLLKAMYVYTSMVDLPCILL